MIRKLLFVFCLLALVTLPEKGQSQISITNSSALNQNFDGIGTSATASLPANWKMTAAGIASPTWSEVGNFTAVNQAASSGSPATGGRYNWGNGTTTTDRAVGFMTSGGYASPNSIMAEYENNTGGTITALAIAFDIERYRVNTAAAAVTFFVSTDGSTWVENTDGASGAFATGSSTYTFTGGTTVSRSFNITGLTLANGSKYYLRWNFNTTGGNSQGLGLDNVSLTATFSVATPTITLNNNTQIGAGNVNQSDLNHLLSRFSVNVATTSATLNSLSFTSGGDFVAGDITHFELYTSATNTFPGGTPLSTVSAGAMANGVTVTFSGLSQACAIGDRYFWIAADISATAGAGRTVSVPSLGASNFTFAAGSPTGSIDAGGAQTFVAAAPEIALSSPASSTADITQGANNQTVYRFDLAVTVANATLNGLTINTAGTYVAADLTNLKAWYSADATFNAGSDVLLSTKNTGLAPGSQVFPSFASQVISNGSTGYIFITADLPLTATAGSTLSVDAVTTADISFVTGNKSGTANASGTKTIIACTPTNVTSLNLTAGNGQIAVSWVNPVCFDEMLIVAKPSSSVAGTPNGDGSAYTANLAFGTGGATAFDGTGFVVYKGSTSPQTITGLTNGTTYFVDVFTRRGSVWSAGTESSATPNLVNATAILYSSSGSATWLTAGNWTGSTIPTGSQVAQFGTTNPSSAGSGINFNSTTNAGVQSTGQRIQEVGAIEIINNRSAAMLIGNNSGTPAATGQLRLNGAIVNSTENVVIRNNSNQNLTIQNIQGSGTSSMSVILNDADENILSVDGSGNMIFSSLISSAAGPVKVSGSGTGIVEFQGANAYTTNTVVASTTLRLNRTGGTTLPATNNVSVNGGTLRVSTNQELNDLTVGASGTLTIDASTTLTINDDLSLSGTLNNSGTLRLNKAAGNTVASSSSFNITTGTLRISSNQTLVDLTIASGATLTIDAGVILNVTGNLSIAGTLSNAGTLNIGANTVAFSGTATGAGVIRSNGATLNITGTGAVGTLNFDQTTEGTTNTLANLTLNRTSSGSLTLGNKLNLTGELTLTNGTLASGGHLHLKSTSASSTARINGGTNASITGNVNFERFLPWASANNSGFRFMSHSLRTAPVINTITGLPVASNSLIGYNETNNAYEGVNNRTGTWPLATGYGVYTEAVTTLTYAGQPQLDEVGPISLSRNSARWHYLGNPFPSVLDWDAVSRTDVQNAVWVWEKDNTAPGSGVWGSYVDGMTANNGSRYIAPGQGFIVRANTTGSGSITFPAAARSNAANPSYYRQSNNQSDVLRVRVTKASNQFSIETLIRFRDQATAAFDGAYDAEFMSDFSNNSPDLYTTDAQGIKYSINSLAPLATQPVLVPLQLETFGAGDYSFTFNSAAMQSGASIQLEDTKTGTFTAIGNGSVVNFTAGSNDAAGRFRLHFNGLATSVAGNMLDQVQVFTYNGQLFVRGLEQADQVRIVDMTGRTVYQATSVSLSADGIHPQLAAGTYLVQLVSKSGIKTAKVKF